MYLLRQSSLCLLRCLPRCQLVDAAGPLSGGALASRLHGHTKHGDTAVTEVSVGACGSVTQDVCVERYVWM